MFARPFRIAGGILAGFMLVLAGFTLFAARTAVYPWWYPRGQVGERLPECSGYQQRVYVHCHDPKKSLGLDFSEFRASINTDQVEGTGDPRGRAIGVTGWSIPVERPEPKAAVVLVHGGGADRRALLKHARYLHEAGYHALLIDCHNHGMTKDDDRGISFGLWESYSVIAAVEWAATHASPGQSVPVFVMGTSQGAFAALRAAAYSRLVRAVVAENPYVSARRVLTEFPAFEWLPSVARSGAAALLGFWLGRALDAIDFREFGTLIGARPVLLVHGEKDRVVGPEHSREIYEALRGPKELWLVKEGEHEFVWNVAKREYERRIIRFLDSAAGRP